MLNHSVKLNDPKSKSAVQCLDDVLKYQAIATNGTFLRRILKDTMYVRRVAFYFMEGKTLDIFDEKIGQLLEAGIIDYFNTEHTEYVNPKRYDHLHPNGPKVLTLGHLRAGFVIWLVSVMFAILVFFLEWMIRLINLLIVHYLFSAFYKTKQVYTIRKFDGNIIYLSRIRQDEITETDDGLDKI